jgi:uncharacterized protein (DUF983 family)
MSEEFREKTGKKKWWFNIAAMGIICIFLIAIDVIQTGRITWSVLPVAAILILGVAFSLLRKFGTE